MRSPWPNASRSDQSVAATLLVLFATATISVPQTSSIEAISFTSAAKTIEQPNQALLQPTHISIQHVSSEQQTLELQTTDATPALSANDAESTETESSSGSEQSHQPAASATSPTPTPSTTITAATREELDEIEDLIEQIEFELAQLEEIPALPDIGDSIETTGVDAPPIPATFEAASLP